VPFRRGFKTEANSIALEVRGELGLRPFDPLDPHVLAEWLEIPIWTLSEMCSEHPRYQVPADNGA
jgi:hypothetical protein